MSTKYMLESFDIEVLTTVAPIMVGIKDVHDKTIVKRCIPIHCQYPDFPILQSDGGALLINIADSYPNCRRRSW